MSELWNIIGGLDDGRCKIDSLNKAIGALLGIANDRDAERDMVELIEEYVEGMKETLTELRAECRKLEEQAEEKEAMKQNSRRTSKLINTEAECRHKANAWGKDEGREVQDALFHYLLIRARCQRGGDLGVLEHVNSALKLYVEAAEILNPAPGGESQDNSFSS